MRRFKIIAVILFLIVLVLAGVFITNLGPVRAEDAEKVEFKVKEGTSTSEVTQQLEREGLIKNSFSLYVYLKLIGGKILPGVYEVTPSQSASDIGWMLGSGKYKTVRLTIKEGWWASDIESELVEELSLEQMVGFTEKAKAYEGYLFPDTYELRVDATIDQVIKTLRDNFVTRTKGLKVEPDVVILASIIEREATKSDRAAISGVYFNRIKIGMRLEADATIQYAKGSPNYIVRVEDYRSVVSPYNTYLNDGMPPGPISNPGLESINAALNPEDHDYLFYFHAQGQTHLSKTLAEHRAKVAKYF